ncbi:Hpt domain-containing protein [uncultured Arthrobacter sp.]|uniref:Hpt domain-containing protein n=1 Tax=uncultured Arthrobacter sp. TaxID=114050 RepID=UPI003216DB68
MSFLSAPDDGDAATAFSPGAFPGGAAPAVADVAPLVDPAALQDLGVQLESPTLAKGFARDYARMWAQRYNCLASALDRRDEAGSLEAVLSLKTSSAMVGGVQLARLAGELEDAVRSGDMDRASSLLGEVAESGSETVDELQYSYILWDS